MALPPDDPPPGVPEWVVTYGDMMSLLLTFFIMLVSMAEMKNDGKMRRMLDSMQERFGPTDGKYGVPGPVFSESGSHPHAASGGSASEGGAKKAGLDTGGVAGPSRTVRRLGHGTEITLGGAAVFERFSAELTDTAKSDLEAIARVIGPRPNRIVVRGHATREALPPHADYRDAMDLSFARAQSGADYLIQLGIDRKRLGVAATGASEPKVVSRDPTSQSQNRRIDVFVIDEYTTPAKTAAVHSPLGTNTSQNMRTRGGREATIRF